jgi:hypothetical protein
MIATCNIFDPQALWAGERDWFEGDPPKKICLLAIIGSILTQVWMVVA